MKKMLALQSLLLSISIALLPETGFASQSQKTGKIVCTESSLDENTNEKTIIGELIVTLDKEGHPVSVKIDRKKSAGLPPIKKTFDVKAKIKGEIVNQQNTETESTALRKVKVISAKDLDGRSIVLKINDRSYAGLSESSYIYEHSKIEISSLKEFSVVSCEGELKVPSI